MKIEDNFAKNEILFNNKFEKNLNENNVGSEINNASFGDVLKNYMDDTNNKLVQADSATTSFIKGDDVNIDDVMVKNQEASLSLQFLAQTRDKLIEGYNLLTKMQV